MGVATRAEATHGPTGVGTTGVEATDERSASPRPEPNQHDPRPVIFFDGVCGLCNRFVDFVIRRDTAAVFRFAPLQGETARQLLSDAELSELKTVVLWDEQGVFRKSAAVMRIFSRLGGGSRLFAAALGIMPRPVRDAGYSIVVRYRYAILGKKETCRMPTAAERSRFLP
jgi:predicted DCC family thiol-disulfide oxidoreductase YuxK